MDVAEKRNVAITRMRIIFRNTMHLPNLLFHHRNKSYSHDETTNIIATKISMCKERFQYSLCIGLSKHTILPPNEFEIKTMSLKKVYDRSRVFKKSLNSPPILWFWRANSTIVFIYSILLPVS